MLLLHLSAATIPHGRSPDAAAAGVDDAQRTTDARGCPMQQHPSPAQARPSQEAHADAVHGYMGIGLQLSQGWVKVGPGLSLGWVWVGSGWVWVARVGSGLGLGWVGIESGLG